MNTPYRQRDLARLVARTIDALDNARLPLDLPGTAHLNENRKRLRTQLSARIYPHLVRGQLPTVVVFGGSSGAGKSTVFNSLVKEEISPASVLRPTTREPVIAMHPSCREVMEDHAITDMGRVVYTEEAIPGMVLVDAPDLDSVDAGNRELSHRLLDAADLWLFVTTAARYGDASAWNTLVDAHKRGMSTAVVLNRVSSEALSAIRDDLVSRMASQGMGEIPLLVVPDAGPRDSLLEFKDVVEIHDWLSVVSAAEVGKSLVEYTSQAMLPELRGQLMELSEAVDMHANAVQDIMDKAREAAEQPIAKLSINSKMGRYGQGAPTTAWLTFASTGGVLASLVAEGKPRGSSDARSEAAKVVFDGVEGAVRVGIEQGIVTAQTNITEAWESDPVPTKEYAKAAAARVDSESIIEHALQGWAEDRAEIVRGWEGPWFDEAGVSALLGAAAGGVAGAEKALVTIGLGGSLKAARDALALRVEAAIEEVVESYVGVLEEIEVGNGRELRLRASEYLDRV